MSATHEEHQRNFVLRYYTYPEGMVRTFNHEEPSSFETLGSQFSVLRVVPNWDSGQTQSPSSLGPKVQIQTHGSLKYAFWVYAPNQRILAKMYFMEQAAFSLSSKKGTPNNFSGAISLHFLFFLIFFFCLSLLHLNCNLTLPYPQIIHISSLKLLISEPT